MAWTACGTIQISRDWQYTEPIAQGSYFRLKHTEAPNGGLFAIAQCEVDSEGKLSVGDSQILATEKGVSDIIKLPKTAYTYRRIAIKKITSLPSLEQEIRRLFLPNFLMPIEQEINYIRRNNWQVDIEVSDYSDAVGTGSTNRFDAIDAKLIAIEEKINNSSNSNGGTTPDTTSDPDFGSVTFLAHFDTDFTDIKAHPITPFGNPQISTAQSKFGSASAYFGGDSYLQTGATADFAIGGNFSIECFVRFNSVGNAPHVFQLGRDDYNRFVVLLLNGRWYLYFSSTNRLVDSGVIATANTWYHVALINTAGTTKLYVDGVSILSATDALPSGNLILQLGYQAFGNNPNDYLNGYIDEIRITKGIARYTSNFNPPNQPFSNN